jgi:hypothetical protein
MNRPLLRIVFVGCCSAALVVGSMYAPRGFRHMPVFQVDQVQVNGVRHLQAEAAVAASGISRESNLFDDPAVWVDALLEHPLVAHASVERRMPGTLVLNVRESRPVAFARTPELRIIDEAGRVLPADPAADDMDLPVLVVTTRVSAQGRAVDAHTLRIAKLLGIIGRVEPGLLGWISEADVYGDAVRLILRNASAVEMLVAADPAADRLRELHLTLAELAIPRGDDADDATHALDAGADLSRVRRIDGRFHDQVVVALHGGKN